MLNLNLNKHIPGHQVSGYLTGLILNFCLSILVSPTVSAQNNSAQNITAQSNTVQNITAPKKIVLESKDLWIKAPSQIQNLTASLVPDEENQPNSRIRITAEVSGGCGQDFLAELNQESSQSRLSFFQLTKAQSPIQPVCQQTIEFDWIPSLSKSSSPNRVQLVVSSGQMHQWHGNTLVPPQDFLVWAKRKKIRISSRQGDVPGAEYGGLTVTQRARPFTEADTLTLVSSWIAAAVSHFTCNVKSPETQQTHSFAILSGRFDTSDENIYLKVMGIPGTQPVKESELQMACEKTLLTHLLALRRSEVIPFDFPSIMNVEIENLDQLKAQNLVR